MPKNAEEPQPTTKRAAPDVEVAGGASAYIEALRVERIGYERRGLSDRVQQVDEAIAKAKAKA
ncbi:MAG: hypothetical protein RJA49_2421 [Actinomycetota bacterium]|jgi:hypothetical protein